MFNSIYRMQASYGIINGEHQECANSPEIMNEQPTAIPVPSNSNDAIEAEAFDPFQPLATERYLNKPCLDKLSPGNIIVRGGFAYTVRPEDQSLGGFNRLPKRIKDQLCDIYECEAHFKAATAQHSRRGRHKVSGVEDHHGTSVKPEESSPKPKCETLKVVVPFDPFNL